jgi:acetoin utilization protein AcuB
MTPKPLTVAEDVPLEEAARVMADRSIGGLPVVRGAAVVGIITESDLFRVFIELFGARQKGVRASVVVTNEPGGLAKVSAAITKAGANIIALGTFLAGEPAQGRIAVKVEGITKEQLAAALVPVTLKIEDIRET